MQKLVRATLIGLLLLERSDTAHGFVIPPVAPRSAGLQHTTFTAARVLERPQALSSTGVGGGAAKSGLVGASAAERLRSHSVGSCASDVTMGIGIGGMGRQVGKGLAAAAFATGGFFTRRNAVVGASVAALGLLATLAIKVLDTPSRPYDADANTVGNEYDAWTEDGILESYWGEHIHLGYYNEEERKKGAFRKDFIQAKYDFIDEMAKWGGVEVGTEKTPKKVLDVGCGVGGTSRYLAKKLGTDTNVTGITLSPKQVERATQLAKEQGVPNAKFQVTNALDMTFEDDSFDLVWACESGEHMPDKGKYIDEMTRVLKPGGNLVVATWCQRDNSTQPFSPEEEKKLDFLYSEWTHPHFISINDYAKLMDKTGQLEQIESADWAEPTTPTWRLSIWVGVVNPWPWLRVPRAYYKTVRDAWCIERMHQAFTKGLMQYGMIKSVKKAAEVKEAPPAVADEAVLSPTDAKGDPGNDRPPGVNSPAVTSPASLAKAPEEKSPSAVDDAAATQLVRSEKKVIEGEGKGGPGVLEQADMKQAPASAEAQGQERQTEESDAGKATEDGSSPPVIVP